MRELKSSETTLNHMHSARPSSLVAVFLFICMVLLLSLPATTVAAPAPAKLIKRVAKFDRSLKQCSTSAKVTFIPNRAVVAFLSVATPDGKIVIKGSPVHVKKGAKKTLCWDGRAGWNNGIGLASGDLVRPGTYRVKLTVKCGDRFFQNVSKTVKVSSTGRQSIKQVDLNSSLYLSPSGNPGNYQAIIKLKRKADVVFEVFHPATGARLVRKVYRNQPNNKNVKLSWNGRFTISGTMEVQPNIPSQAGRALPPGAYTIRIKSGNSTVFKKIIVRLAPKLSWESRMDTWAFPLNVKKTSKLTPTQSFGASRGGGRKHAGIDLLAPSGTAVYAMSDGVVEEVLKGIFFAGTGVVQVRHSDGIVIRYCEIKPGSNMKKGVRISKNQRLGAVQRSFIGSSMLHLESYSGRSSGNLTVRSSGTSYLHVKSGSYMRRRDLFNPMGVALLRIPSSR